MRLHQVSILTCLFTFTVALARGLSVQDGGSPSSRGQLQDIRYPFCLKNDPPKWGDPRFELTCDANRIVIDYHSGKYYVESISYVNKSIQINDIGLANRGCSLPSHILSPDTRLRDNDPGVMGATLCPLFDLITADVNSYKDLVISFVSILKQVAERRLPKTYDYHHMPAPFIRIKLLKILALLGNGDKQASGHMYTDLGDIIRKSEPSSNTGNAVLYECSYTTTWTFNYYRVHGKWKLRHFDIWRQ